MLSAEIPIIDLTRLAFSDSISDQNVELFKHHNNQVVCLQLMINGTIVDKFYKVNFTLGEGKLKLHKQHATFQLIHPPERESDAVPCYQVTLIDSCLRKNELELLCLSEPLEEVIFEPIQVAEIQERVETKYKLNQELYKTAVKTKTKSNYKSNRKALLEQLKMTKSCLSAPATLVAIEVLNKFEPDQVLSLLQSIDENEELEDSIKQEVKEVAWNQQIIRNALKRMETEIDSPKPPLDLPSPSYTESYALVDDAKPVPWPKKVVRLKEASSYDKESQEFALRKAGFQLIERLQIEQTKKEVNLDLKHQAQTLLQENLHQLDMASNKNFSQLTNLVEPCLEIVEKIKDLRSVIAESKKEIHSLKVALDIISGELGEVCSQNEL